MIVPTQDLDALFPLPALPPSVLSPTPGPGVTRESAQALVELLKKNHVEFHCFFNDRGFHNHLSHHLYAAFFLGATPSLLEAAFDYHASYLKPAYESPSEIDLNNWKEHLGDEKYYAAYMAFFSSELLKHGLEPTLEKFFFSTDANWGSHDGDAHPEMLSRILAGLIHPFIHAGHGMEFIQLGMVAEGFAQAAVHNITTSKLISREFLVSSAPPAGSLTATLMSKLSITSATVQKPSESHPFSILARMLRDERLTPIKPASDVEIRFLFLDTISSRGEVIRQYAEAWDADASSPAAVSKRLEEIAWVVVLLYGVGGWKKDRPFKADFFMMHLVTSSLFISSMLAHLSPDSKRQLLRSYFVVVLGYWVAQGRPSLSIQAFYSGTRTDLVPPGPQPTPHPDTLDKERVIPNPWYPLLQSTLMHPGEHVLKLERALAHFASLYGTTPSKTFVNTELEGAETLDGTLFLRVAWLSLSRNGWVREGDGKGGWDFEGFFDE